MSLLRTTSKQMLESVLWLKTSKRQSEKEIQLFIDTIAGLSTTDVMTLLTLRCLALVSLDWLSTGRSLRTIWRGCEDTLFPVILEENYKDSCGFGNFFVECTRTCDGAMCNLNHTGIPQCWWVLVEGYSMTINTNNDVDGWSTVIATKDITQIILS